MFVCPSPDWSVFHEQTETICLKLMPEPMLFNDAFKTCDSVQARLLSFSHKQSKILFVNDLIIKSTGENHTLWFFDPLDTTRELVGGEHHDEPSRGAAPRWLVISTNPDKSKIDLIVNTTVVPRRFICEAPAHPAAKQVQLVREPEDVFISEELLKEAPKDPKRAPFIVSFNCQAYGIPKPDVHWVMVSDASDTKRLTTEAINATEINEQIPQDSAHSGQLAFFNLKRDCIGQPCPPDNIQERHQLIVVNAHLLDAKKRIACLASNTFGAVISREAQIFITKLGAFANATETVSVHAGFSTIVSNVIPSDPDAASIECFRVLKPAPLPEHPQKEGPAAAVANLVSSEDVNRITRGGIQLSKAKFDLIIDAASTSDAGQFLCHARLHNGRFGHVIREHLINLEVTSCGKADTSCDTASKPVSVVPGYPAALSMNYLSNHYIRTGDDFLLECPCTGKRNIGEDIWVEWNLNNRTDMPKDNMGLLPWNSALLIYNADVRIHTGIYQCRCRRGTESSAWSSIEVAVLPSPTPRFPDAVHVKSGQTAVMECSFPDLEGTDGAVSVTVQPMRGAKPLTEALTEADAQRFSLKRISPTQYSATITDVKPSDEGVYGCRVIANYMGKWLDYNTYYTTLIVEKTSRR